MPNATPSEPTNPTITNPPVALAAGVVPRGDGFGQATDAFVFDLGQEAFGSAAMTTIVTGSPTSLTVQLQGSIDGLTWVTIATSTSTTGDTQYSAPGNQFTTLRVNVVSPVGGATPKIGFALTGYASTTGTSSPSSPYIPASANILSGSATAANTVAAQTIITVPAGRTWYGTVNMEIAAAGTALVTANVNTAGAGAVPAAAVNLCSVTADPVTAAGNVANQQTTPAPFYVVAPAANAVTLALTNTSATTNTSHASALGTLL